MSTVIAKNIQIGTSGTPAQNFTWYQPASPDGTVRLGVGNTGATTLDAITATSAGNVTVSGSLAGGALSGSSLAVSGATTTGSLTVNSNAISAVNSLGFRNRILNGGMVIDQRNAGASQTPTADDTYNVDRWAAGINVASKFSMQQNTADAPTTQGFSTCVKITSLSAYSLAAGDVAVYKQTIEGFNIADLAWGTASARSVTLSFWVRSSLTGTFGGTMMNSAQNRAYPFTYTISAANTWEQKTITVAGDTTGTWLTNNGAGIKLGFQLGVGSTFTGTAGSWTANNFWGATGATNLLGTNGATFYITGVQLEAGTVASPFERRDYGRELMMCQRYYYKWVNDTGGDVYPFALQSYSASGAFGKYFDLPVTMRATPTCSSSGTFTGMSSSGGSTTAFSGVLVNAPTKNTIATNDTTGSSGMTAGQCQPMRVSNNAFIAASAEL